MKLLKSILPGAAFCALAFSLQAAPALVTHPGIAAEMTAADIESVLLGKKVTIGSQRVVIVLAADNADQEAYLKATIGKTESQFRNHWRRLFMTGGGTAPTEVDSIDALLAKIAATPGAIGIVDDGKAGDLGVIAQ
jgi:hypothetical protein